MGRVVLSGVGGVLGSAVGEGCGEESLNKTAQISLRSLGRPVRYCELRGGRSRYCEERVGPTAATPSSSLLFGVDRGYVAAIG